LSDRPVINGRTKRDDRHDGPQQAGERLRPHTISPYFNRIDSMELTVSKIRSVRRPFAVDESRHNVLLRKLDGVIGGGEIGSRLVIRELQAEVIQERDPEILALRWTGAGDIGREILLRHDFRIGADIFARQAIPVGITPLQRELVCIAHLVRTSS